MGEGRKVKALQQRVEAVTALEPEMEKLSDGALSVKTDEFRERLVGGETLGDILPEAFAVVRETSRRTLGMRPFDVQVMGGIALHQGKIAEMKTGEGKTLAATMPVYLNALTGKGVHVVTVNDYLARRDAGWMGETYAFLGLEVGLIQESMDFDERKIAYHSDITYGTNAQFGFDYLRDNIATSTEQLVQRELNFAIVDEVDSILIDEARTPLIISGMPESAADVEYIVRDGQVFIVDEFTGRVLEGRRYSEGLHQAIEAKERVEIREENQTVATITIQNFFRQYEKLSGMTGTAATEADEFMHTYKMEVVSIPTHKEMIRDDKDDLVYKTKKSKYGAVVEDIVERNREGQPILVSTVSVEVSEHLSNLLKRRGIRHNVLNAKHHEREAEIVAEAGERGAVTIATNMAGRGTDIKLGPGVPDLGGLYVLGTERHESRRIDNQLRGRSGRQGDPGESRFYLSFEDDLLRRFRSGAVEAVMDRFNIPEDVPIESKMVSKQIKSAQGQIEGQNAEIRKNVLKYDEVLNKQRQVVYAERKRVLDGEDLHDQVRHMIDDLIDAYVTGATAEGYAEDWDLEQLWTSLKQVYPVGVTIDDLVDEVGGERSTLDVEFLISQLKDDAHTAYDRREEEL